MATPPVMDAADGLGTAGNATCNSYVTQNANVVNYYALASCVYIAVAAFLTPRRRLRRDLCRGVPGMVYPVDLLTDTSRRAAVAAAYLLCGSRIYLVIRGRNYWMPDEYAVPEAFHTYPFLKVLLAYIFIAQLSVCFYCILLSVRLRRYIIANVAGIIAVIPWVWTSASYYIGFNECLAIRGLDDAINALANDIPAWIAATVLIASFIYDLVQNIRRWQDKNPEEEIQYGRSHYGTYVKALLKQERHDDDQENTKMLEKYRAVQNFRYPTRIVITFVISLFALFRMAISMSLNMKNYHDAYKAGVYDGVIRVIFIKLNSTDSIPMARTSIIVFMYAFWFSVANALFWLTVMLIQTGKRYRKHTLMLFRGDRSWMSQMYKNLSPIEIMPNQLRFTGYQIAFAAFGFLLMMVMTLLVVCLVALGLIVPLAYGASSPIVVNMYTAWPTLFIAITITVCQKITAKKFFLQEQGQILAVDNKRVYHVLEYFLYFVNIIWGSYVAMRRVIFAMFIGALRIARLDYSFMPCGFQSMDEGYMTYHCILLMDLHTYHPVMRSFLEVLQFEAGKRLNDPDPGSELCLKRRRIRLRWLKYVTLLRNPSLILDYQLTRNAEQENVVRTDKLSYDVDLSVNNDRRTSFCSVTEV